MDTSALGLLLSVEDRPGALHDLTGVIARHGANIVSVEIFDRRDGRATNYFEIEGVADPNGLVEDLRGLSRVAEIVVVEPLSSVYGKRVIVIGGGAQVGQVAVGAISEADRHNIRG